MFQKIMPVLFLSLSLFGCSSTNVKKIIVAENNLGKPISRAIASHSWGTYHWARTTAQFSLKVGDNLTLKSWQDNLSKAATDWNNPGLFSVSSPLIVNKVAGTGSKTRSSMVAGTTQVYNNKYGRNGWLGLASINITNGNHITQGTAKLNDTYFNTSTYNNVNERQHVMCQEIAHTFGLDHQSVDGGSLNTCMDYFSNTGVNATSTQSISPNLHDFEELTRIYATLDTNTTIAQSAVSTLASQVTEDPTTWGEFIAEKSEGQSGYYERHHKDGSETITHVYWTLDSIAGCADCDHRERNTHGAH